ncbi:hypothetical protein HCH_03986 [Hahella chejuensis KCTC 2396]|uniref:DUF4253 domain-containing protein n=1 Tax=Hahella chejuensis (strain KCTC 2396) TaxID=349521 RepID=Q2SF70_HAHCH|nr:hypothetical protein [Hahella chejuensis]ABC30704.1 hypothetical protein HCH_03986 [Hahella chejuensis KCTC 2396]
MNLEYIDTPSEDFLCDRYHITEINSFEELLVAYRELAASHPDCRFLLTLDDLGQACYTAMHSTQSHDLDNTDDFDLSKLPPECFEDGEHKGYLSHKDEFPIRRRNMEAKLKEHTLADVIARGVSLNEDAPEDIEDVNADPLSILDAETYLLKVPVTASHETIFAFPNGYFTCDLNPFENVVLAKHLDDHFGYQLMGLGASYLAFLKTKPLDHNAIQQLIDTLDQIYRDEFDDEMKEMLRGIISNSSVLVLKYTE